jgi:AmiR/NasT family two-component response regulator
MRTRGQTRPDEARPQTGAHAIEALSVEDLRIECMRLRTLVGRLESTLQSRMAIKQAKGILAERLQLRPDDAFQLLAQSSSG